MTGSLLTTGTGAWRPATAMVLAAGLGTRIRGVDPALPKPLIRLGGRALIDHVLDRLAAAHIPRAVVNVHWKADLIEAHLASRRAPQIVISDERASLLDTGGGVVKVLPLLGPGAFLRHNSDSVWIEPQTDQNILALCEAWRPRDMTCLLLLAPRRTALGYEGNGDFHLEGDGRIRRRAMGEHADYVYAGVDIFAPSAFVSAPIGAFSLNRIWDACLAEGRAFGRELNGRWMHVGTPEALADAEAALRDAEARPI
jgi:N-acetyl-alpha-D-muramate 1-phosphate uridylyltransferase